MLRQLLPRNLLIEIPIEPTGLLATTATFTGAALIVSAYWSWDSGANPANTANAQEEAGLQIT